MARRRMPSSIRILLQFFLVLLLASGVMMFLFFHTEYRTTTIRLEQVQKKNSIAIESAIFENIKDNGTNPHSNGLWVNWQYGATPMQGNFDASGQPDGVNVPVRHDPVTDIRYLDLLTTDTRYPDQEKIYTDIVKKELQASIPKTTGMYEVLIDLHKKTGDAFYKDKAQELATYYEKKIDPKAGIPYQSNQYHPYGYYYVADVADQAASLIMAGTQFSNTDWTEKGKKMLDFLYSHAYDSTHKIFPQAMDTVITSSGTINTQEKPYQTNAEDDQIKTATLAHISHSLLVAYTVTHTGDYLSKAEEIAAQLTKSNNTLSLWDSENNGYLAGTSLTKHDKKQTTVQKNMQDQIDMLWVFHTLNEHTDNTYKDQEKLLLSLIPKIYYEKGHGVLSQTTADWKPVKTSNGFQTWIDTAATEEFLSTLLALTHEDIFSLAFSPTPTPTFTPTPSPKPTLTPTATLTPFPTKITPGISVSPTATPSATPVVHCIPTPPCLVKAPHCLAPVPADRWCAAVLDQHIPSPTITPVPNTTFSISVSFPQSFATRDPLHTERLLTISAYDSEQQLLSRKTDTITYNAQTKLFTGQFGFSLPTQQRVIITADTLGFTTATASSMINAKFNTVNTVPLIHFVSHDVNEDGVIDIYDYNAILSCIGSRKETCEYKEVSDLNDDGVIDMNDIMLFVDEIQTKH